VDMAGGHKNALTSAISLQGVHGGHLFYPYREK
jgi:hypothetical protein